MDFTFENELAGKIARVTGTFPGIPAKLPYHRNLKNNWINSLRISG
ncbi:hypothetical protein [Siphonobacter curvatus]|nr:hypothetical protein [Siphonobacter curvatus]